MATRMTANGVSTTTTLGTEQYEVSGLMDILSDETVSKNH